VQGTPPKCAKSPAFCATANCALARKFQIVGADFSPPCLARPSCMRNASSGRTSQYVNSFTAKNAWIRTRVDASRRFLYDEQRIGWALSSAVRAFGLHPKGRPFKSDSAHHCDASPFSGDVVQLVRTLPRRLLESHTVTANSLPRYKTSRAQRICKGCLPPVT
jgi:hypothetical protein